MVERWKFIVGYEGVYQVSSFGRIRRLTPSEHLLSPCDNGNGYFRVSLCVHGHVAKFYIHRLVASAFLPPATKNQIEVNHINGNGLDNRVSNLEWTTRLENEKHAIARLGKSNRGEANGRALLTPAKVKEIRALHHEGKLSRKEIAGLFFVSYWTVCDIITERRWKHI